LHEAALEAEHQSTTFPTFLVQGLQVDGSLRGKLRKKLDEVHRLNGRARGYPQVADEEGTRVKGIPLGDIQLY